MITFLELFGLLILFMLPFLYETNHVFRYYFKFLIYYGIVSLNSILLIPVFLFRPCDVRNLLLASAFCHRVSGLIGLKWELRGKEHLEKDQACIIIANHQSSLDVLGMFDIWPIMNKCTVVAKRELFYAWPFGLAAWLAGLVFIDRVRGEKARDTLNAVNTSVKQQKIKLWIFPEGTRRNTGEIHPFKKGAFHMAIDEQIPILPVVFSSYCSFLNDQKRILNSGQIIITAMPCIQTVGLTKDDMPDLMARIHKMMSETFKQTSAEILQRYAANSLVKNRQNNTISALDNASTAATGAASVNNTSIQPTSATLANCSFNCNNTNSICCTITSTISTSNKDKLYNCRSCRCSSNNSGNISCKNNCGDTRDKKCLSSLTTAAITIKDNTETFYQDTLTTTNTPRAIVQ